MRQETIVHYFAEDGTPFDTNKLACQSYETLCIKYKKWLQDGKVMFWDHYENYINFELCDYTFTDNICYLEWLRKKLSKDVGYLIIHEHPCSEAWTDIWDFVVSYCIIDKDVAKKIENTYCEGDMLNFDVCDGKFHNIDLVTRRAKAVKERIMNAVASDFIKRHSVEEGTECKN